MQVQTRRRPASMDPTASHPETSYDAPPGFGSPGGTYRSRSGTAYWSGLDPAAAGKGKAAPAGSRPSAGRPPSGTKARTKRKDPLWARLVVIFGAVLMMAAGGTIVGSKVLIGRYTDSVTQDNLLGGAAKVAEGKALEGDINILLLGVDERANNPGDVRSDTIIILHVPVSRREAYLISVPRDTFVDVPAFEKSGYPGGRSKITDAFYAGSRNGAGRAGGAQLVAQIINGLTGIRFDSAAIIDFRGFRRVIDALGGVTMCVDHPVKSQHMRLIDGRAVYIAEARKLGGGEPVSYEKGCRKMAGWQALDYSRQRYGLPDGDYGRQRHQQQLIKAMAKQATSKGIITDIRKLDRVIKAAGSAFILDTGGVPIADFVFTLKGVAASDLVLVKTNAGAFNSAGVKGQSAEALSPKSLEMFAAVKDGTLADWLLEHPKFIAKDK